MSEIQPVKPVCQNCGSACISSLVYKEWNVPSQRWVEVDGRTDCASCDMGLIEFIPLTFKELAALAIEKAEKEKE